MGLQQIRVGRETIFVEVYSEITSHDLPNGIVGIRVKCKAPGKLKKRNCICNYLFQVCSKSEDLETVMENMEKLFNNYESSSGWWGYKYSISIIDWVDERARLFSASVIVDYRKNLHK